MTDDICIKFYYSNIKGKRMQMKTIKITTMNFTSM